MTLANDRCYRFGAFVLDLPNRQLRLGDKAVFLRSRPFDLLSVLVQRAGHLVSKDELLDLAWPGVIVEENNLQVQVSVLRKILGADAIATVPGRGYRFALATEALASSPAPPLAPPDQVPADPAVSLFGRDDDVAAVIDRLRRARLVSVVGPGGIGKTRVALAVRQHLAGRFAHGAIWVELASLSDPALLANHVMAVTAVPIEPLHAASPVDSLVHALDGRDALLILDNAEHLLTAVSDLAKTVLARLPGLRLLVTSQAPLRLSGEQVVRLDSLPLPPPGPDWQRAMSYGAVALFVARAQSADHRFRLTDDNLARVVEICRQLDGIPLAIELAAARVPLFGLTGVLTRLNERFRLLGGGRRDAPSRQQTLLAVFDWSYQLLDPQEQAVFRRLGVIAGPFALEQGAALAAESTQTAAPDDWRVFDAIGTLVERSLVTMDDSDPPRYSLLETGRAYALKKLMDAGEFEAIARASRWYEAAGDRASAAASGGEALENYSTALELARHLAPSGADEERELEVCLKLGPAIQATLSPTHRRCEEVYRRSVALARRAGPDARSFKAVWGYWQFLTLSGRVRQAMLYADEILQMAPWLGDDGLELEALHAAMTTRDLLGNAEAVIAHANRISEVYDCDRHHALTFSFGGHDPGVCALGQGSVNLWLVGRPQEALRMADRALALGDSLTHLYSRSVAYFWASITLAACGEPDAFGRVADRLLSLSEDFGMEMSLSESRVLSGRARFDQADAGGIAQMRDALGVIESRNDLGFILVYFSMFADALIRTGEIDEADAVLERGLRYADLGQELLLPEIYRLRGEVAARRSNHINAMQDFDTALTLADRQGASSLALRALTSMARLGEGSAFDRLQERLTQLEAGASTREWQEMRALLASRKRGEFDRAAGMGNSR